jgi:hypothetical protein
MVVPGLSVAEVETDSSAKLILARQNDPLNDAHTAAILLLLLLANSGLMSVVTI